MLGAPRPVLQSAMTVEQGLEMRAGMNQSVLGSSPSVSKAWYWPLTVVEEAKPRSSTFPLVCGDLLISGP